MEKSGVADCEFWDTAAAAAAAAKSENPPRWSDSKKCDGPVVVDVDSYGPRSSSYDETFRCFINFFTFDRRF